MLRTYIRLLHSRMGAVKGELHSLLFELGLLNVCRRCHFNTLMTVEL